MGWDFDAPDLEGRKVFATFTTKDLGEPGCFLNEDASGAPGVVYTSPRKLEVFTGREILVTIFRQLGKGRRGLRSRKGLRIWYRWR